MVSAATVMDDKLSLNALTFAQQQRKPPTFRREASPVKGTCGQAIARPPRRATSYLIAILPRWQSMQPAAPLRLVRTAAPVCCGSKALPHAAAAARKRHPRSPPSVR